MAHSQLPLILHSADSYRKLKLRCALKEHTLLVTCIPLNDAVKLVLGAALGKWSLRNGNIMPRVGVLREQSGLTGKKAATIGSTGVGVPFVPSTCTLILGIEGMNAVFTTTYACYRLLSPSLTSCLRNLNIECGRIEAARFVRGERFTSVMTVLVQNLYRDTPMLERVTVTVVERGRGGDRSVDRQGGSSEDEEALS
jgi:hypothetical protein